MEVKDRLILGKFIRYAGLSYASLAEEVRKRAKTPGPSKATIGHLVTGVTTSTKPEWARAIEEILDAPRGSLFVPKVSRVSQDVA